MKKSSMIDEFDWQISGEEHNYIRKDCGISVKAYCEIAGNFKYNVPLAKSTLWHIEQKKIISIGNFNVLRAAINNDIALEKSLQKVLKIREEKIKAQQAKQNKKMYY